MRAIIVAGAFTCSCGAGNPRFPLLDAFDRPDTIASCPKRNRSTTAPQVLVLLNSEFAYDAAAGLALNLQADVQDVKRQIETLYLACLGRSPTQAELADSDSSSLPTTAGLSIFVALFNLNEFAYVD